MEALPLDDRRGVVLGTIFDRSSEAAPFDETAPRVSATVSLTERCWGNYVAVLRERVTGTITLLRGPMSTLPCYLYMHHDVCVCFSHLADFHDLGLPLSICWDYIAAQALYLGRPSTEKTGIEDVTQVRPGECVQFLGATATRRFYWNPLHIAAEEPVDEPDRAVKMLRRCTKSCVHAWASRHSRILHMLSGGLDSSIVLACLLDAPTRPVVNCFVEHSPHWTVDERPFARAAATAARCGLYEVLRESDVDFEPLTQLPLVSPDPSHLVGAVEAGRARAALAATCGATAISTGIGGDQVFHQAPASQGVRDYLQLRGLRPDLFRIAYSAARIEKLSIWKVLERAFGGRQSSGRWQPLGDMPKERSLVSEQLFARTELSALYVHPWFDDVDGVPIGKLQHIHTLANRPFYYDPLGTANDPAAIAPLLSQPLVELCLRIPTYVHTEGGWDRSMARRAFEPELPHEITWRRGKGELGGHHRSMIVRNLSLIRGMLLEGELVRRGMLDGSRLESFLTLHPSRLGPGYAQILEYLSLEAWIQSTSSHAQTATWDHL
jgi:asparagine synthase (glutamine-hydrolysing)